MSRSTHMFTAAHGATCSQMAFQGIKVPIDGHPPTVSESCGSNVGSLDFNALQETFCKRTVLYKQVACMSRPVATCVDLL